MVICHALLLRAQPGILRFRTLQNTSQYPIFQQLLPSAIIISLALKKNIFYIYFINIYLNSILQKLISVAAMIGMIIVSSQEATGKIFFIHMPMGMASPH